MNQPNETVQDEISIRELIETIWNGKIIIAIVTAAAILLSIIASFFILPEQYQAAVALKVSPLTISLSELGDFVSIVDYLAVLPKATKADYLEQVKSAKVLEATIQKLALKTSSGEYISTSSLSNAITVTDAEKTDRINITVTYKDPKTAAAIANTLSQVFSEYVAEESKAQIQETADKISQQMLDEAQTLDEKKTALNDYRSNNKDIDVLKGEVANLVLQIVTYKNSLQEIQTCIKTETVTLQALESASQSTSIISSDDFNLEIDINDDLYSLGQNQVTVSPDSLPDAILTINISNLQAKLVNDMAIKQIYEQRIPELESALNESQTLVTNEEYKYNAVYQDVAMAQLTYNAYQQRNREVLVYSSSEIGGTIITLVSEASVPGQPVSPNKKKNIAVAGAVGFCLSVVFVLFRNYWRRSKTSSPK